MLDKWEKRLEKEWVWEYIIDGFLVFGEIQAAGMITIAHKSAGPLKDII